MKVSMFSFGFKNAYVSSNDIVSDEEDFMRITLHPSGSYLHTNVLSFADEDLIKWGWPEDVW